MIIKGVVYFIQSGEGCQKKAMEYALVLEALIFISLPVLTQVHDFFPKFG